MPRHHHRPRDPRRVDPLSAPYRNYVVFDVETTGLDPENGATLIEIGAVRFHRDEQVDVFSTLIDPQCELPEFITELTGIAPDMLDGQPTQSEAYAMFDKWVGADSLVIAHNAPFDMGFLDAAARQTGMQGFDHYFLDTLEMSRRLHPQWRHHRVADLIVRYGIADTEAHRGLQDSLQEAALYRIMRRQYFRV